MKSILFTILLTLSSLGLALDQATDPETLARGKYLYQLSNCVMCHTSDANKPLAGGYALPTNFGVFYTPNISSDKKTGIGNWTDKQFIKALRQGISPKGEYYYPAFPYTNYSKITDADLLAIRDYMASLPGYEQENKAHLLRGVYKDRSLLFFWRALYFQRSAEFNPQENPEWNRGAYLVEGPMHCTQCHTPRNRIGGLEVSKWFSGAKIGKEGAPNLTPDLKTGLGHWQTTDWETFLKHGLNADGDPVGGEMRQIVKLATSQLTDDDAHTVIIYLQSLKPIESSVGN